MSVCDTCRKPGHCCNGFELHLRGEKEMSLEQVKTELATMVSYMRGNRAVRQPVPFEQVKDQPHARLGLPYRPLYRRTDGSWRYGCPLLVNGRCSDYANRPAICVAYEPKSDPLCIEWEPPADAPAEVSA